MHEESPRQSLGSKLIFQNAYVWLIFLSSLDIMCTWVVLWHNGMELNPFAASVLKYGAKGLVAYKFALVVFVILLCEVVGRRNRRAAIVLVGASIALTCIPVIFAMAQLAGHEYGVG